LTPDGHGSGRSRISDKTSLKSILAKIERILNALAFANARNRHEFEILLAAGRVPTATPFARVTRVGGLSG